MIAERKRPPLTEPEVIAMRLAFATGESQISIAARTDRTPDSIRKIVHGEIYAWCSGPIKLRCGGYVKEREDVRAAAVARQAAGFSWRPRGLDPDAVAWALSGAPGAEARMIRAMLARPDRRAVVWPVVAP
jgi:hypothetical protein